MAHLTVYGLGNRGRDVVDQLLAKGQQISMIFDRAGLATTYRGIPVRNLDDPEAAAMAADSNCLIALHNSYVDIKAVHYRLKSLNSTTISLINADSHGLRIDVNAGYWLNKKAPGFIITEEDAIFIRGILADEKSRTLFDALKRYRETGDLAECPIPSTTDEYTPGDLPRYPEPVNLLDYGAYDGSTYRKFARTYSLNCYIGVEPDPENFARLQTNEFTSGVTTILLPIGAWHRSEVLRFQMGKKMGSSIDASGEAIIQCAAIDDVIKYSSVNVVKLDVEGAEAAALLGMRSLVRQHRPSLAVSVYHRPEDLVAITRMLHDWRLGYQFFLRMHEHNAFGTVLYARP